MKNKNNYNKINIKYYIVERWVYLWKWKLKNEDKAFTMVELLATIVILGVVMMIAVTSITRMLEKAKKEYYTATEKEVKLAGESYVQNSRKYLPKRIGQKTKISLKEM